MQEISRYSWEERRMLYFALIVLREKKISKIKVTKGLSYKVKPVSLIQVCMMYVLQQQLVAHNKNHCTSSITTLHCYYRHLMPWEGVRGVVVGLSCLPGWNDRRQCVIFFLVFKKKKKKASHTNAWRTTLTYFHTYVLRKFPFILSTLLFVLTWQGVGAEGCRSPRWAEPSTALWHSRAEQLWQSKCSGLTGHHSLGKSRRRRKGCLQFAFSFSLP